MGRTWPLTSLIDKLNLTGKRWLPRADEVITAYVQSKEFQEVAKFGSRNDLVSRYIWVQENMYLKGKIGVDELFENIQKLDGTMK